MNAAVAKKPDEGMSTPEEKPRRRGPGKPFKPGDKTGRPKGKKTQDQWRPVITGVLTRGKLRKMLEGLLEIATSAPEIRDRLKAAEMILKVREQTEASHGSSQKAQGSPKAIIAALKEMDQ